MGAITSTCRRSRVTERMREFNQKPWRQQKEELEAAKDKAASRLDEAKRDVEMRCGKVAELHSKADKLVHTMADAYEVNPALFFKLQGEHDLLRIDFRAEEQMLKLSRITAQTIAKNKSRLEQKIAHGDSIHSIRESVDDFGGLTSTDIANFETTIELAANQSDAMTLISDDIQDKFISTNEGEQTPVSLHFPEFKLTSKAKTSVTKITPTAVTSTMAPLLQNEAQSPALVAVNVI